MLREKCLECDDLAWKSQLQSQRLTVADGSFFHLEHVCLGTISKYDKIVFIYFSFLFIDFFNNNYC